MAEPIITIPQGQTGDQVAQALGSGFTNQAEAEKAGFIFKPSLVSNIPDTTPALGITNKSTNASATSVPDWATSLISNNPFDTTSQAYKEAKNARDKAIEDRLNLRTQEIQAESERAQGGVGAKFQQGSRTGIGYDSIKEAQVNDIKKEASKAVENARLAAEEAKVSGDQTALDNAMKQYQLALDIKNQATTEALNQAKLKLDALTTAASMPKGQTFEIAGTTYTGLAEPSVDTQIVTDNDGNVSVINKATGELISTLEGVGPAEVKKLQYNEVNGQLIITDPTTGQEIKRIVVPKQGGSSGINFPTPMSINDFAKTYSEELGKSKGMSISYSPDNPLVQNAYKEYTNQFNASIPASAYQKLLSKTDYQAMIAKGYNSNNTEDIRKYLQEKNDKASAYGALAGILDAYANQSTTERE